MATGSVYRAAHGRDRNGDPIDADGNVVRTGDLVGSIDGLIVGGASVASQTGRGEVASTEGMIGAPRHASIKLQHGDRLVLDDATYQVAGPRQWDSPSVFGADLGYYWCRVEAAVN